MLAAPFIGSFLGVLVARLPSGRQVIWGRSHCEHCGHALGIADLMPIASWATSKGRCRYCAAAVTPLYTGIEAGALVIAIWAASLTEGWELWAGCCLGWGLLALAIIDWRDGLLPDAITLPLLALGLAFAAIAAPSLVLPHAIGAAAGFASFALIRWLYHWLRRRDGLGFGDVKLFAAAGAWLSWEGLPSVVLIAAVFSLGMALFGAVRGHPVKLDQRLAFGPGLCVGAWVIWLYGPLQ